MFITPDPSGTSSKDIPETTAPNTQIYTIEAQDDEGGNITYNLTGQEPDLQKFVLDAMAIRTNGAFDYETMPTSYVLTFR